VIWPQVTSEFGIQIAPSTILRWVIRYAVNFAAYWRPFQRPVGRSRRGDATYIKAGGQWKYLYRAVDQRGHSVESHLSCRRDVNAPRLSFARR
jgi:putative transposase